MTDHPLTDPLAPAFLAAIAAHGTGTERVLLTEIVRLRTLIVRNASIREADHADAEAIRRIVAEEAGCSDASRTLATILPAHGEAAVRLVVRLHEEDALSEGQCSKALGMDRLDFRRLCDDVRMQDEAAQ